MTRQGRALAKKIEHELTSSDWVNIRIQQLLEKAERIIRKVGRGLVYRRVRREAYTRPAQKARRIEAYYTVRLVRAMP